MTIRWTYAFADRPAARLADACAFWTAVTGTRLSAFRGDRGEFVTLLPEGADPSGKLQGVTDGAGGAHIDLCTEDVRELTGRARQHGAALVADHGDWAVLRSPAGLLFCAVPWHGETVRPPVVSGSRLDQVCLDIPPSRYDSESAFWAGLTGWERLPGSRPEFTVLRPPAGLPHRLLLQRLDEDRPASAHLDLACADIPAVRARHEKLGAVVASEGAHWTVMRDPAGGLYCLTGRDPETGGLPGVGPARGAADAG
ncbi:MULTISPECIES: VOC family protein [Streptomyces]|uniref:VOC family protein n=1 Tax=Streptomyces tricolor TaxID=68277 RepID=A0ABS9JR83_9ACTN|nr:MULTISPECIES: VOC family protein [Streptomyces]MCG0068081.1 VOC family protein [Streptomyces tricolor]OYP15439.1 VOC family protein [Streptomyces sp. FBKL.4005]